MDANGFRAKQEVRIVETPSETERFVHCQTDRTFRLGVVSRISTAAGSTEWTAANRTAGAENAPTESIYLTTTRIL